MVHNVYIFFWYVSTNELMLVFFETLNLQNSDMIQRQGKNALYYLLTRTNISIICIQQYGTKIACQNLIF